MKIKLDSFFSFLAVALWASAFAFTKLALEHFSVTSLSFLRYLFASIFFLFFIILKKIKLPKVKDLPTFILSGFIGYSFYIYAFNRGSLDTSAALSSIIISVAPILTAFLSRILYREKIKRSSYFAVVIQFFGILIIFSSGGKLKISQGMIWIILAMISLSFFNILQKRLLKNYGTLEVTVYSIFFATLFLIPFMKVSLQEIKTAGIMQIFNVFFLGVISSAIGSLCWIIALAHTNKVSTVSNFLFLMPVLSTAFGLIILKEIPKLSTIIGGIVIIYGSFYFQHLNKQLICTIEEEKKGKDYFVNFINNDIN